jgi:hypothetical protein
MVYIYVAGCWISGNVETEVGDCLVVRLVTGQQVSRPCGEVRLTSPRLDNSDDWPL